MSTIVGRPINRKLLLVKEIVELKKLFDQTEFYAIKADALYVKMEVDKTREKTLVIAEKLENGSFSYV